MRLYVLSWWQEVACTRVGPLLFDRKSFTWELFYSCTQEVIYMRVSLFLYTENHIHEGESISVHRKWNRVSLFLYTGSHLPESESIPVDRKSFTREWVYSSSQEVIYMRVSLFLFTGSHLHKSESSCTKEVIYMRVSLFLFTGSHLHESESIPVHRKSFTWELVYSCTQEVIYMRWRLFLFTGSHLQESVSIYSPSQEVTCIGVTLFLFLNDRKCLYGNTQ